MVLILAKEGPRDAVGSPKQEAADPVKLKPGPLTKKGPPIPKGVPSSVSPTSPRTTSHPRPDDFTGGAHTGA